MNCSIDEGYINRMFDDWTAQRNILMMEMKNDKEMTHEKFLTAKIACIDNILKSILKYRNLNVKEKIKLDGF